MRQVNFILNEVKQSYLNQHNVQLHRVVQTYNNKTIRRA